jgi:phosphoribosylformylglycinamidine synthase
MEPFEIMVSESQERMLCVVEPGTVEEVLALCEKWEVGGAAIGEVTGSGRVRVLRGEEVLGDMPVAALVDECPLYDLRPEKPLVSLYAPAPARVSGSEPPRETLLALLASPNLSSRRSLFEQYDSIVQSRTVRRPEEADAAVLELPDGSALAVSIDGNGRRVAADPYRGTIANVLECAANLACVGAEPLGTTNNLNFGNPEKPHVAWQLSESVRGLGEACRALAAPIVGGNVSLYNESPPPAGPIYPTPVVGMVGSVPDVRRAGRTGFAREGDAIALVGPFAPSLLASELAKLRGEPLPDGLPPIDLEAVVATQRLVREAVRDALIASAHDIAEGGVAVALAECCLAGDGLGARVRLDGADLERLFGECSGAFVVSGAEAALRSLAQATGVEVIGTVEGGALVVGEQIDISLAELREAHGALEELFV